MNSDEMFSRFPVLEGCRDRMVSASEAVKLVQPGNDVYLGSACATPRLLSNALENLKAPPAGLTLWHFQTNGAIPHQGDKSLTRYRHKCFFVDRDVLAAIVDGKAEYIPISLSEVPRLLENRRILIDVALIQVSLPDEFGYCSFGVSVDVTAAMVQHAKLVIAEINPNMPRTQGDSLVHVDRFAQLVWNDAPVLEYQRKPADEITQRIARNVAHLVEDRCTLQIGIGRLPGEVLKYLGDRRDLGVHTDVLTDDFLELIEKGVVTGREKSHYRGMIVASYCLGTRRLYDLIDGNSLFSFQSIERVCDFKTISQQHRMVSVNQACAIDLSGQVCTDQSRDRFCGGVATHAEFVRGAAHSPGGKPVICLQSTSEDGTASRIRAQLSGGEGVGVARQDVHYVATEYGVAFLFGKTLRERALALIHIAHPDFRADLLQEAKRIGYVRQEDELRNPGAYAAEEERKLVLRSQKTVLIRPTRIGDAAALQQFYRHMSSEDRYTRFFRRFNNLSDEEALRLCNTDQDNVVAFLVVWKEDDKEELIGSACYFVNPSSNLADVAYMVAPKWQGVGIGKALQLRLMEHAKARGLRGFTAEIQAYNPNMINLAKQACDNISIQRHGETHEVVMLFE